MGWDGAGNVNRDSGVFTGTQVWQNSRDAGRKIRADDMDTHDQDLADAMEKCLNRDGENSPTTNISWGSNKITSLAAATATTDAARLGQVISTGKHTIWVPADAMSATTSMGASKAIVETTALRPDIRVFDFHKSTTITAGSFVINTWYEIKTVGTTDFTLIGAASNTIGVVFQATGAGSGTGDAYEADEAVQFSITFPKSWDEGTVTARFFSTHAGAQTGGLDGVSWGIEAVAVSDDDTLDVAYGTPVVVTEDLIVTGEDLNRSAESSALTIAGTPADGDLTYFRVFRDVSVAGNDMDQDARLLGVKLFYTVTGQNDA